MDKRKLIIIFSIISVLVIVIAVSLASVIHRVTTKASVDLKNNNENSVKQPPLIVDTIGEEENTDEFEQKNDDNTEQPNPIDENKDISNIPSQYYIKVNNQANVVTIYTRDDEGNYTKPYKAMVCSIGRATPAAGNKYTIPGKKWDRYIWGKMQGNVYAQYYVRITGNILFHSVPYTNQSKDSLEYWEYDKLGTKASAGCIRLTAEDAKWIYDNCKPGTQVEFYESADPGPLGKPTAQKISNHEQVRGWDPTDPDPRNPWKTYNPNVNVNDQVPGDFIEQPETNNPDLEKPSIPPTEPSVPDDDNKDETSKEDTPETKPEEPTKPDNGETEPNPEPDKPDTKPDSETDDEKDNESESNKQPEESEDDNNE